MTKRASDSIQYFENPNGPKIGTVGRKVFEKDGLYYKDIDGTGEISSVNDWHLSAEERAKAYVKELTVDEKIAMLFISDWRMGPKYPYKNVKDHKPVGDESGELDEAEVHGKTIFGQQDLPGTTVLLKDWKNRNLILRDNPTPSDMASYLDQLQAVAEECDHFVPVLVASNSRNENGEVVFGMNDAAGVFATYPGTLGIAAAVKGTGDFSIVDKFADTVRREWLACGLRKGYMYMADTVTDPRWQRTFGTFGEDPDLIEEIVDHLIPGIQNGSNGENPNGISLTLKHFPGGGARENGFDPHYKEGQWNVYATEDSLATYHMRTFRSAIRHKVASIMPYYSKPSANKSSSQKDFEGNPIPLRPFGFAYNREFIDRILRKQMDFEGYINSDTGIIHNMCWGVENLDIPERIGFAVTQSGVDMVSGLFDNEAGKEAYERSKNDYYETHPIPDGYQKEDIVLTDESIDRACVRTLTEKFKLGMFENPYADPAHAEEVIHNEEDWNEANITHRKSVVLLKNTDVLPLTKQKCSGKKIYAEAFAVTAEKGEASTKALREMLQEYNLVEDYHDADYALLMVSPSSGAYFNATKGYLELDICENKTVCNVNSDGTPSTEVHEETTLCGVEKIREIAEAVHKNGGKVISNINVNLAWIVGNVEKYSDALTVGFDTYPSAILDVIFGKFNPVGKLPLTLPRGDEVLHVNEDGICVSRNDIPGFLKDQYMPDELKDENGKAYAYRDSENHYYEYGFGLKYE